jgi:hypothetical protein
VNVTGAVVVAAVVAVVFAVTVVVVVVVEISWPRADLKNPKLCRNISLRRVVKGHVRWKQFNLLPLDSAGAGAGAGVLFTFSHTMRYRSVHTYHTDRSATTSTTSPE